MLKSKILVTGSSGTIGTRLCEKLLDEGFSVVGVDSKPNIWNKEVQEKTILVDLRDKEAVLTKLPTDIDIIIHLAANARVYNLVLDPSLARDNFETTFNMLEFARLHTIKKFIFSSSREVYGNTSKEMLKEEDISVERCESAYTASKIAGEALVRSYQQCYHIDFILFRFSNVYGRYDSSDRVIPLFIAHCKEDKDLVVFGDDKLLDFTYIDDTVNGIMQSIEQFDKVKNKTYNLAYGKGTSIREVAEYIKEKLQSKSKIITKENRTGEVVTFIADISLARKEIGYDPKTSIQKGLDKTIQWYSDNFVK